MGGSGWLWFSLLASAGCSEWPRSANLPDSGSELPGSSDPGDLFELDWAMADEPSHGDTDPNADPALSKANLGSTLLSLGHGVVVNGQLESTGWNENASPDPLRTWADCNAFDVFPETLDKGFYTGDRDFYVIEIGDLGAETASLCGVVASSHAQLGWDLLLVDLKTCDEAPLVVRESGSDAVLGYGLGGEAGYWSTPVSTGGHYALLFAGYTVPEPNPDGPEEPIPYRLGAALIQTGGSANPICPNLPSESPGKEE